MTKRPILTRELVRRLPERIPDPGPMLGVVRSPDLEDRMMADILGCGGPDSVWLFAFGSLMWKRSVPTVEMRPATIRGWLRAFCLGPDRRYRGNPDAPDDMLSLDRGGMCPASPCGFIPTASRRRSGRSSSSSRSPARLGEGRDRPRSRPGLRLHLPRDIAFYARRLPDDELARHLAKAVGMFGSMADYLLNALEQLEALGIRDNSLRRLASLVAAEMEALPPA